MSKHAFLSSLLGPQLTNEILERSEIKDIPKGTEILREEQYVKVLPLVVEGLVKVFSRFEDRELLLYYIQPNQSCVMSFTAALKNEPSKVFATTEEDSKILLIPVGKLSIWLKNFPQLNHLFYEQFNLRYVDLLETIHHVLLDKMDKRLYDYLIQKANLTGTDVLKLTHGQIANELGTVREVISRVIKKLEIEDKLTQDSGFIKILR